MLLVFSLAIIPFLFASFPRTNSSQDVRKFQNYNYSVIEVPSIVFHHETFLGRTDGFHNSVPEDFENPHKQPRVNHLKRRREISAVDGKRNKSRRPTRDFRAPFPKSTAFQESGQLVVMDDTIFMFPKNDSKPYSPPKFERVDVNTLLPGSSSESKY